MVLGLRVMISWNEISKWIRSKSINPVRLPYNISDINLVNFSKWGYYDDWTFDKVKDCEKDGTA